jgi:hypothetical protein
MKHISHQTHANNPTFVAEWRVSDSCERVNELSVMRQQLVDVHFVARFEQENPVRILVLPKTREQEHHGMQTKLSQAQQVGEHVRSVLLQNALMNMW